MEEIYALCEPDGQTIRYVGRSKDSRNRFYQHKNRALKGNTHKDNWIKKLFKQGSEPVLIILDKVDRSIIVETEEYWIWQCKSWGFNLTNITNGGEPLLLSNRVKESWDNGTRREISERPEVKEKLREGGSKIWINLTEDQRAKRIEGMKERASKPRSLRSTAKEIIAVNIETNEEVVYGSVFRMIKELQLKESKIYEVLSGSRNSYKGYRFKRV